MEEKLMDCPATVCWPCDVVKRRCADTDIRIDEEEARHPIEKKIYYRQGRMRAATKEAIEDSFKRLLQTSIEAEMRVLTKQMADRSRECVCR